VRILKEKIEGNYIYYYNDEKYLEIPDLIETLEIKEVFKDNQRSKVGLLDFKGEELVFKIPREKNSRRWQRFISPIRGSEARREFLQSEKVEKEGFKSFKPILAVEKKKGIFVVDSYFICTYLKAEEGSFKYVERIKKELKRIHSKGFLHGDSQLVNFMIDKENIYIIDTKLSKNIYGKIGQMYEMLFLQRSSPEDIEIEGKETLAYKLAKALEDYLLWWGRVRKKRKDLKKKLKG